MLRGLRVGATPEQVIAVLGQPFWRDANQLEYPQLGVWFWLGVTKSTTTDSSAR